MILRSYQRECVDRNIDAMNRGVKSTLNSLFTGAGKTVIFVAMSEAIDGRTLIITPMRELVWQAVDKVRAITDRYPDIEMAEYVADEGWPSKVVVASKQTLLARRGGEARYRRLSGFQLVVVDEAHIMCSDTVVEMLRYFQDGGAMIAGFTATPFRMDGKPLMGDKKWTSTKSLSETSICDGQSTTSTECLPSAPSQPLTAWTSQGLLFPAATSIS